MRKIDRFDKFMEFKGLNDNKVTVQIGLSVGTLGKSRKPGRDLPDKVIEQILNFYPDLSKIWLLTGEGEMLKTENEEPKTEVLHLQELIKTQAETISSQKLLIETLLDKIQGLQRALEERG